MGSGTSGSRVEKRREAAALTRKRTVKLDGRAVVAIRPPVMPPRPMPRL
jgi:hypothetical protein